MRRLAAFSSMLLALAFVPALGACARQPTRGEGAISSPPSGMTTVLEPSSTGDALDGGARRATSGTAHPLENASGATMPGRDDGGATSSPVLCGCGLCAPVVSDDACAKDADCAPATPCHATRCVGLAHAAPRTSGTMCTQVLACASVDANHCGCLAGNCALSPRGDAAP